MYVCVSLSLLSKNDFLLSINPVLNHENRVVVNYYTWNDDVYMVLICVLLVHVRNLNASTPIYMYIKCMFVYY